MKMKVLFKANDAKTQGLESTNEVVEFLKSLSFEVFSLDGSYGCPAAGNLNNVDFAVILGGDGTIIEFARQYKDYSLPIFGINLGRVGALAVSELSNYKSYLTKISKGEYKISERITLEATLKGTKEILFNDISIASVNNDLGNFFVVVNDKYENSFYADGLVVSTPTGSSAYNYSAGGPLLLETNTAYVLTPICPQFIAFNSVVLSKVDEISIKICKNDSVASCDGCNKYQLSKEDEIKIKVGKTKLKLISFEERNTLYGAIYKIAKSIYKD